MRRNPGFEARFADHGLATGAAVATGSVRSQTNVRSPVEPIAAREHKLRRDRALVRNPRVCGRIAWAGRCARYHRRAQSAESDGLSAGRLVCHAGLFIARAGAQAAYRRSQAHPSRRSARSRLRCETTRRTLCCSGWCVRSMRLATSALCSTARWSISTGWKPEHWPLRLHYTIGSRVPLHCSAIGKILSCAVAVAAPEPAIAMP